MDNKNLNSLKEEAKLLSEYITNVKSKLDGKDPNSYTRDEIAKIYQSEGFQKYKQSKKTKAAHGAKLQYFRTLKNQCADDEELYYYKKGGSVGCGCKKKEDGGEIKKDCKGSAVVKFKMQFGNKMMQLTEANKNRKKAEEEKKRKEKTWGATSTIVRKNSGNGDVNSKVQDNVDSSEYVPDSKAMSLSYIKEYESKKKTAGKSKLDHLKCGGEAVKKFKVKKHQYGNPIYLTQSDYLGGINLLKRGANKIWDLMNYNITNNPNIITGAPDFLPGTGGGNIGKVVGQIRKIAPRSF